MESPFTKEEKEVSDLIVKAHNLFSDIEQTHPSDLPDWVNAIHQLQNIIGMRVLRRDYPETYKTIK